MLCCVAGALATVCVDAAGNSRTLCSNWRETKAEESWEQDVICKIKKKRRKRAHLVTRRLRKMYERRKILRVVDCGLLASQSIPSEMEVDLRDAPLNCKKLDLSRFGGQRLRHPDGKRTKASAKKENASICVCVEPGTILRGAIFSFLFGGRFFPTCPLDPPPRTNKQARP